MFHVLVVEDELLIRDAIVEMVNQAGGDYKVVGEASSVEEAWMLIHELWPTILITDIQMPDSSGLDLIRQIREHQLPIVSIIVSGHDRFEYARHAIHYGVSEYLLKPISEQELHHSLRSSLNRLEHVLEPNRILTMMQQYLDGMHAMDQLDILKQGDEIAHAILTNRVLAQGAKISFLKIYWGKLHEHVKAIRPDYKAGPFDPAQDSHAVRLAIKGIMHDWIKYYPQHASNNMRLVIRKACEFIQKQYTDDLTQKEMAEYCNLSVSYFGVLFKQYTGHTFINYLNQIRIDKSRELLGHTDLKIYEISERVGYASLPYFNRVFKNLTGLTPNEYRKSLGL